MTTRICFISTTRYSKPLTGSQRSKFSLLKALGDVNVVSFSRERNPRVFNEEARFYLLPGLHSHLLRYLSALLLFPLTFAWVLVTKRPQVVIAQSPHVGFAAAVFKRVLRIFGKDFAFIVESHGDFEESIFLQRKIPFPKVVRSILAFIGEFTCQSADRFRAVSKETGIQLTQYTKEVPLDVFVTWTEIDKFFAASGERNVADILYAGVLVPRKGVHHLISAVSDLVEEFPGVQLLVAGPADNEDYASELRIQVEKLHLVERVHFLGPLTQDELAQRMATSTVFAFPSYSEGQPRAVFEAMATGTPVVATAVSGIPEVIIPEETGLLVQAGDEHGLAENLARILRSPELAKSLGENARAFASTNFSKEQYFEGYRKMVLAVTQGPTRTLNHPLVMNS